MPKSKYSSEGYPWKERVCPICHKIFIPAPLHIYKTKYKSKLICSYKCRCIYEKTIIDRRKTYGGQGKAIFR